MTEVQVTVTIPEGYELAETRVRCPRKGERFLDIDGRVDTALEDMQDKFPILRPIAPQYVYPKVRREDAEEVASWDIHTSKTAERVAAAMREALEAKGEPEVAHGKCCLCAVRNPYMGTSPQPKVTVGECGAHYNRSNFETNSVSSGLCGLPANHEGRHGQPEPVCGKHHHDGKEHKPLCRYEGGDTFCRLPANHEGRHA